MFHFLKLFFLLQGFLLSSLKVYLVCIITVPVKRLASATSESSLLTSTNAQVHLGFYPGLVVNRAVPPWYHSSVEDFNKLNLWLCCLDFFSFYQVEWYERITWSSTLVLGRFLSPNYFIKYLGNVWKTFLCSIVKDNSNKPHMRMRFVLIQGRVFAVLKHKQGWEKLHLYQMHLFISFTEIVNWLVALCCLSQLSFLSFLAKASSFFFPVYFALRTQY